MTILREASPQRQLVPLNEGLSVDSQPEGRSYTHAGSWLEWRTLAVSGTVIVMGRPGAL